MLGLLGGLAAVTDLGAGAPADESLRRCLVATRLARAVGCTDDQVRDVLYVSLLEHIGCTAYAHESARVWGDDIATTRLAFVTNFAEPRDLLRTWVPGVASATGTSRVRTLATTLTAGRSSAEGPVATCEVAREAARRLGLTEPVQQGLGHILAMWNGKGHPRLPGESIPLTTRLVHVASVAVLFLHHAGTAEAAVAEVRNRSGTYLDPDLASAFLSRSGELLDGVERVDAYEAVLDVEPDPVLLVDQPDLVAVAHTFGDLVDLKSLWLQGHSAAVADLAANAAERLGLDAHQLRVAGHLHDVGRAAVSSRVWDKAAPWTATERDQARLHAYHGERVLARVPALVDMAPLVGQHHERCDGSGYHRGVTGDRLTLAARVLAAADAYRGLVEDRPHRGAVTSGTAAELLRGEVRAGRLDGDAVAAVLEVAGHRQGARRPRPAGLTDRQVEVLRLLAAGLSNRDIADRLVISRRTAEHHVQDVYARIGASRRAAAALFAMEHGLLGRDG